MEKLTLLEATDEILEEVDGDGIICWQIHADVDAEEVVDLALAVELRCEGCSSDLLALVLHAVDL